MIFPGLNIYKIVLFIVAQDVTLQLLYNKWLGKPTESVMTYKIDSEIKPPVGEILQDLYRVFENGGIFEYAGLKLCYDVTDFKYIIFFTLVDKEPFYFSGYNKHVEEIYELMLDILKGEIEYSDV